MRNSKKLEKIPKISVLVPTARAGGMEILLRNFRNQTFRDFELIIVDKLWNKRKKLLKRLFILEDFPVKHLPDPPMREGDVWRLEGAYNRGLENCQGELIVSLQDYILIRGDGLEKFWNAYQSLGKNVLISGVGHKYSYPKVVDIDNPICIFEKEPMISDLVEIMERDSRVDGRQEIVETNYTFFELNWAAIPRKVLMEINYFDERLDQNYGCDNLLIGLKAFLKGYKIYLDKTNECYGIYHQGIWSRPADWEEKHANKGRYAEIAQEILAQ
jgi:glycosyltransferase involved in cell wall biosynthesis